MYVPLYEGSEATFYAMIRTTGDSAALAATLKKTISTLDRDVPAFEIRTMDGVLDESAAPTEYIALLLSGIRHVSRRGRGGGIVRRASYAVAQRTGEIGIRMALGAARPQVLNLVLFEGLRPPIGGLAAGMLGALWATQFLRSLLFGVGPIR